MLVRVVAVPGQPAQSIVVCCCSGAIVLWSVTAALPLLLPGFPTATSQVPCPWQCFGCGTLDCAGFTTS